MNITVRQGEIQKRTDQSIVVNLFEGVRLLTQLARNWRKKS